MRIYWIVIVATALFIILGSPAEEVSLVEYLPENCVKSKPIRGRDPEEAYYYYYSDKEKTTVVARELQKRGRTIRLELLDAEKNRHGIQREWYQNGILKSESPYDHEAMHGWFRAWDDKGSLIANYYIDRGTGIKRVYDPTGALREETAFKNSSVDGINYTVEINGRIGLAMYEHGKLLWGFAFNKDESLSFYSIAVVANGARSGMYMDFNKGESISKVHYKIGDREVTEEEYAAKSAKNPDLPVYKPDPNDYKRAKTPEIMAILHKYKNAPPVKIPLTTPLKMQHLENALFSLRKLFH